MRGWTATPSTPTRFGQFGDVYRDDGIFVPAGAKFDGERNLYGRAHGTENFTEKVKVAEQAGAAALHDFFGRAAEIDVHGIVAQVFDHFCGAGHDFADWRRKVVR